MTPSNRAETESNRLTFYSIPRPVEISLENQREAFTFDVNGSNDNVRPTKFILHMINRPLFLGLLIVSGCNNSKQSSQAESGKDSVNSTVPKEKSVLDEARVEGVTDTSLFCLISKPGAVHLVPDTAIINARKKTMTEDEWNTVIDDEQFYVYEAKQSLEKNGIEITYLKNDRRYLKFKKKSGQYFTVDRKKIDDFNGLILFNGVDNPVALIGTDAGSAIKKVFKK
jgi:hypothetical protein